MTKRTPVLTEDQIATFRKTGHLTVPNVFDATEITEAIADLDAWSQAFLRDLSDDQRGWFLESGSEKPLLRKLDNPVYHREVFRRMAGQSKLLSIVHQLIGPGVAVFFSQVFMKPPEVGGPKPIHQDNFYFGPDDLDATLTAWVALDEATVDNGCLYYSETFEDRVLPHVAPSNEPFNLQMLPEDIAPLVMQPAPVPSGGVSFHHGNAPHQSSANHSKRPRRAAAFHYLHRGARLVAPALRYDPDYFVAIS